MMDHFELLREIWPLLRDRLLDPIEILPNIWGLTDHDIETIKAAMNTSKIAAIDRLYEALRRRDVNCFRSFLRALWEKKYKHLVQEIMTRGHVPQSFLGLDNSEGCVPRVHDTITFPVPQVNSSSLQSSSTPSETQGLKDEAAASLEEEPLTRGTKLEDVPYGISSGWVDELNKKDLWKDLCKKLRFIKRNEVKEMDESGEAGEKLLEKLEKRNFSVNDLMKYLQGAKLLDLLQLIKQDLGEMDYNNLSTSNSQDENSQSSGNFENVVLGIPSPNDSVGKGEDKIENKETDSSSQNIGTPKTSRPSNESNLSASLDSRKKPESCKSMDNITLTGHGITFSQETSVQKEDQLAKNPKSPETMSKHPMESDETSPLIKEDQIEKEGRSSETKSREPSLSVDVSPIIKQTQLEIALANKKKGLEEPYSDTSQMADIDASHQTSLKSQFLDDNLNNSEDLELEEPMTKLNISTDQNPGKRSSMGPENPDDNSVIPEGQDDKSKETGQDDDYSKETSTGDEQQQTEMERPGGLIVSEEQGASNQKGSSLMEGIKDLGEELKQANVQPKPFSPRPPGGNSINIPVQTTEATEVSRSLGFSRNRPNQGVGTATDMSNILAAPESSETLPSCQYNLFPPSNENGSMDGNTMGSQPQQRSNTTVMPVTVTDDSDAKNMEMEANALHEDVTNQLCSGFRDIQNSIPEPTDGIERNRDNQPSLVNQYCYSVEEVTIRSQVQTNISNVPSDSTGGDQDLSENT